MSIESEIREIAKNARSAAIVLATIPTDQKNDLLRKLAVAVDKRSSEIYSENRKDLDLAVQKGLSAAMVDRLTIKPETIKSMAQGLCDIAELEDPVGAVASTWVRPNGLQVSRVRIPLGVIGIIYESRPNVTIDAAGLCLKSGNAVILRGGSEAYCSNQCLATILYDVLTDNGFPQTAVQVLPMKDRQAITCLLRQDTYIDLIIPRGGEGLIRSVAEQSKIPVLKHYKGVCHIYVDDNADLEMAAAICFNAKVQRPGVCNAMETMLVHRSVSIPFLTRISERFRQSGVIIRGCAETCQILPEAEKATEKDWSEEYLDLVLSVRVVTNMEEAIDHIGRYGSNHSEAIVTMNYQHARIFTRVVDASVVLVNASTRFNDGGQLGLGAEMGISTTKLHAYGPMGLQELTTTKFVVLGDGQVRA